MLALGRLGVVTAGSSLYVTEPVGGPADQPPFRNAVVTWVPAPPWRGPRRAVAGLLAVERALGRVRRQRWGPRTIDLDLLAWDGDRGIPASGGRGPAAVVPHPRARERAFVLVPWAEVAPGWRHPDDGRTIADLAAALGRAGGRAAPPAEVRAWEGALRAARGPR